MIIFTSLKIYKKLKNTAKKEKEKKKKRKEKEPSKCTQDLMTGMTQQGLKGLISIIVLPKYAIK